MGADAPPHPTNIATLPNGDLAVAWSDGHESYYGDHYLRCLCPCAACVDEMSGAKTLRDGTVPRDVHPLQVSTVGRYALSVLWSDRHDTGIYSYETLRRICPCDECSR